MTLDEMLRWKAENQDLITEFLHQHRIVSGIHFMTDDGQSAYVEFALKGECDYEEMSRDIDETFGPIDYALEVVDPDKEFEL